MTFEEYARGIIEPGAEVTVDHAKQLMVLLRDHNEEDILTRCVHNRLQIFQRNNARHDERVGELGRAVGCDEVSDFMAVDVAADNRAYLNDTIMIPGEGKVLWGDATVGQLEKRRAYFEAAVEGYKKSIAIIDEAIRLIEDAGVTCLREIPEAA